MPAILVNRPSSKPNIIDHYQQFIANHINLKGRGNRIVPAHCAGFICNAGGAYLKNARLAKAFVAEISNGDGRPESTWRKVPEDEYVWCLALDVGTSQVRCYVLIDDFGWPVLTGKNKYNYLPLIDDIEVAFDTPFGHGQR